MVAVSGVRGVHSNAELGCSPERSQLLEKLVVLIRRLQGLFRELDSNLHFLLSDLVIDLGLDVSRVVSEKAKVIEAIEELRRISVKHSNARIDGPRQANPSPRSGRMRC